ncbi:WD repeat-containing protein 6 [Borealophlyctis nickersoniae]|nr:WD repeat-containing protein 6 [Borealophlyctis nickersoniae]
MVTPGAFGIAKLLRIRSSALERMLHAVYGIVVRVIATLAGKDMMGEMFGASTLIPRGLLWRLGEEMRGCACGTFRLSQGIESVGYNITYALELLINIVIIDSEDQMIHWKLGEESEPEDFVKTFAMVDLSIVMVCTHSGRFLIRNKEAADATFVPVHQDPVFADYSVLFASDSGKVAVAGSIDGHVVVISPSQRFQPIKWKPYNCKVISIFLAEVVGSDEVDMFFFAGEKEEIFWYRVVDLSGTPTVHHIAAITLSPNMTVTSLAYSRHANTLILGSRRGAVAIYKFPPPKPHAASVPAHSSLNLDATLVHRHAHGRDAVTSIVPEEHGGRGDREIVFSTVGRDGCYCRYSLKQVSADDEESPADRANVVEGATWRLECFHKSKITKGWLEKIMIVDDTVLLCGFYNKRFFVYNDTKKYEMFSVACGGAHRRWDFQTNDGFLNKYAFVFLRKYEVHAIFPEETEERHFMDPKLQDNFHGMETRVVRFIDFSRRSTAFLVTAGEDAVLKFHAYDRNRPKENLKSLAAVRKHVSVIRGIDTSYGKTGTLLFTAGAREELRAWNLSIDDSMEVRCLELVCAPMVSPITETRIMDVGVTAISWAPGLHLVGTACSDAFVRVWIFDESKPSFRLLATSQFHQRCVLKCQALAVPVEDGSDMLVLVTAGTDGRIAIWDCSGVVRRFADSSPPPEDFEQDLGSPMFVHQGHQSGVNGLDVRLVTESPASPQLMVASGGDDNGVSVLRVWLKRDGPSTRVDRAASGTVPPTHSSPVSAVRIVNATNVVTTSLDQRLNCWEVSEGTVEPENKKDGDLSLNLHNSYYLDIADISDMDVRFAG